MHFDCYLYLNNLCKEKNQYSAYFHRNYLELLWKNEKLTSLYKNVNNIFMTGWECQKFFNEFLIINYQEQLEKLLYVRKLSVKTIIYTYTGKNNKPQIIDIKDIIKRQKIIDDKRKNPHSNSISFSPDDSLFQFYSDPNCTIVYKNSPKESKLANLINDLIYLEYYSYRLNYNKQDEDFFKNYFIKKNKVMELFYSYSKKIQEKINRLVDIKIYNLLNSCRVNYKNGNIIKAPQSVFGLQPRIFIDKTNIKYKYWYCLDIINENIKDGKKFYEKELLYFPLAYNDKYHKHFIEYNEKVSKSAKKSKSFKLKDLETLLSNTTTNDEKTKLEKQIKQKIANDKRKIDINNVKTFYKQEHIIYLSENTNRLTISLTKNKKYEMLDIEDSIGLDIGGKVENTIATDKTFIPFKHLEDIIIPKLNKLDKIATKERTIEQQKAFNRIFRENISYICQVVSTLLKELKQRNITDIVMEDLQVFGKVKSKSKKLDEKYNRIFRLLRNAGLVEIFRKIAHNLGMRVHTIPCYYTSQRCSKCGHIHEDNRDGDTFICLKCGYKDHSDFNAAKNIDYIFKTFLNEFCVFNKDFGEYNAKKYITKEFVRNTLLTSCAVIQRQHDDKVKKLS